MILNNSLMVYMDWGAIGFYKCCGTSDEVLVPHPVNKGIIRLGDICSCQDAKRANIGYIQPMSNAGRDK